MKRARGDQSALTLVTSATPLHCLQPHTLPPHLVTVHPELSKDTRSLISRPVLYDHLVFIKQLSGAGGQHAHRSQRREGEAPQVHEYCPVLALDNVQEDQVTTSPVTCL